MVFAAAGLVAGSVQTTLVPDAACGSEEAGYPRVGQPVSSVAPAVTSVRPEFSIAVVSAASAVRQEAVTPAARPVVRTAVPGPEDQPAAVG